MTLVVGRLVEGYARIVADAQITVGGENRFRAPHAGALKALALCAQTAVAYSSNDADKAVKAIRDEARRLGHPGRPIDARELGQALRPHTETDEHEFLVASETAFHVARAGTMEWDQASAWLGEYEAFREYQKFYLNEGEANAELILNGNWSGCDPSDVAALAARTKNDAGAREEHWKRLSEAGFTSGDRDRCRMRDAFEAVVVGGRFPSIGNLIVTLTAESAQRSGFRYQPSVAASGFHPVPVTTIPTSVLASKGVDAGGYHESFSVPAEAGVAAIALHLFQGRMGILFLPLEQDEAVAIENVTASEFVDKVWKAYGIRLAGFPWSAAPSPGDVGP
jgi:hypothetical protein